MQVNNLKKKNIIRLHDKAFEISPRKLKMWEN